MEESLADSGKTPPPPKPEPYTNGKFKRRRLSVQEKAKEIVFNKVRLRNKIFLLIFPTDANIEVAS